MSDPASLIDSFLRTAANDDPAQAHAIQALDDAGREQLAGVLGRFDASSKLEANEVRLTIEVLDAFAGIDSDNRVYSEHELELLLAVLRHLDQSNTGRLEKDERMKLRSRLEDPEKFWNEEKANNPLVKDLLAR